jgi:hypothetical protein
MLDLVLEVEPARHAATCAAPVNEVFEKSLARHFCYRPRNPRFARRIQCGQISSNAPRLETGEEQAWRLGRATERTMGAHRVGRVPESM